MSERFRRIRMLDWTNIVRAFLALTQAYIRSSLQPSHLTRRFHPPHLTLLSSYQSMALVILTRNICRPRLALYSSDWSRHSQILVAPCFHQRRGGSISQLRPHCSRAQSNGDCHPDYRSYWYVFPPLSDLMVIGWREYRRTYITTQSTASSPLNAFKISFAYPLNAEWVFAITVPCCDGGTRDALSP